MIDSPDTTHHTDMKVSLLDIARPAKQKGTCYLLVIKLQLFKLWMTLFMIRCCEGFPSRAKTSKCHCFGRQRSRIPMGRLWWVGTYLWWRVRRRTTVVFFCVEGKRDLNNPPFQTVRTGILYSTRVFQRLDDRTEHNTRLSMPFWFVLPFKRATLALDVICSMHHMLIFADSGGL